MNKEIKSYLQKRKLNSKFKEFITEVILLSDEITKENVNSDVEDLRYELHRRIEKKVEIYPELRITKSIDLVDGDLIIVLDSRYEFINSSSIKINLK